MKTIAEWAAEQVAAAPPLSPRIRARLAVLLRAPGYTGPGGGAGIGPTPTGPVQPPAPGRRAA